MDTAHVPHPASATVFCCNGEMDLFAIDGGLVLEVAEERECGVESVELLQLTVRDAKYLRRELDRVLRHRPRPSSGPMVLIPAAEYLRLAACERAIAALPDAVACATMEAGSLPENVVAAAMEDECHV